MADRLVVYVRGIGTTGEEVIDLYEGAFGTGVATRVKQALQAIAGKVEPSDRFFVFGFSRGAAAARLFCEYLRQSGLPKPGDDLNSVFHAFAGAWHPEKCEARVAYLGLWDCVVASVALEGRFGKRWSPQNVDRVRHALALDELRKFFPPVAWGEASPGQSAIEAWFVGSHANIGGGYADKNLSNIALFWVLAGAIRAGLSLNLAIMDGMLAEEAGVGARHSYNEFLNDHFGLFGKLVAHTRAGQGPRRIMQGQRIHESVLDAMSVVPKAEGEPYIPRAIFADGTPITLETARKCMVPWEVNDDGSLAKG